VVVSGDGWLGNGHQRFGEVGVRLEQLCVSCVAGAGVDGLGLTVVTGHGVPETLYATDERSAWIEDLQFTLGEGPCVEAVRSGVPVLVPSLDGWSIQRWPAFGKEAASAGVAAIFAFPVKVGALSLGAIDLHRDSPGGLDDEQLARSADAAERGAALLMAVTADGLHGAAPELTARMVVHQAAGMAMMQLGTSIEEALLRLRATAFAEGITLNELAADMVQRRRRLAREEA
jgi:hypothetical protein